MVAVGRDGLEYAVKRQIDDAHLPASEWFCYHLGYRIQIALPSFAILQEGSDEHFGSRFEGGIKQFSDIPPPDQTRLLVDCAPDISRIIAMDLFVGNEDRHLNNFLFREQRLGGKISVVAMDFSRSLFVRGWPADLFPMPTTTKTMMVLAILKNMGIWDSAVANLVLASIQSVSPVEVERWLTEMPSRWLEPHRIADVKAWWASPEFGKRLNVCSKLV